MKEYELTILVHPDIETDIDLQLSKIRELVKKSGGTILKEDNWGKKKLAYKIKKQDFAIYVYYEANLPPDALLKISNTLNITDEILRYLLVAVDQKGRRALEEAKLRSVARNETEEE